MSGTSLDGLDIVLVQFIEKDNIINHELIHCKTVSYPQKLRERIKKSCDLSLSEIQILDKKIGLFYAEEVQTFIEEFKIESREVSAIASHGQRFCINLKMDSPCNWAVAVHLHITRGLMSLMISEQKM